MGLGQRRGVRSLDGRGFQPGLIGRLFSGYNRPLCWQTLRVDSEADSGAIVKSTASDTAFKSNL
jgi:hypothetical protein